MKSKQVKDMTMAELIVWCSEFPRTAASMLRGYMHLDSSSKIVQRNLQMDLVLAQKQIDHLTELLNPKKVEEPGWPDDCVVKDCTHCRGHHECIDAIRSAHP